jgi:hypothetical protein
VVRGRGEQLARIIGCAATRGGRSKRRVQRAAVHTFTRGRVGCAGGAGGAGERVRRSFADDAAGS